MLDLTRYDTGRAAETIAGIARRTPVLDVEGPDGADLVLKLENLQVTGSFKVRGAANRMLRLAPARRRAGVITCSSGNHGRAVAYVAERIGIPATICVPDWVDPTKLAAIQRHGAEAVLAGATYDEAQERADILAAERGLTWVHPFDDPDVIAGQGTVALELLQDRPAIRRILVPLSGGGLCGGIAAAVQSVNPDVEVIAISARNARVMYESIRAGRPITVDEEETVANALSGGIGLDNRHTFDLIGALVQRHVLVDEPQIRRAMAWAANELHAVAEGGGATALAAALTGEAAGEGLTAVIVSGGNIALDRLTPSALDDVLE